MVLSGKEYKPGMGIMEMLWYRLLGHKEKICKKLTKKGQTQGLPLQQLKSHRCSQADGKLAAVDFPAVLSGQDVLSLGTFIHEMILKAEVYINRI